MSHLQPVLSDKNDYFPSSHHIVNFPPSFRRKSLRLAEKLWYFYPKRTNCILKRAVWWIKDTEFTIKCTYTILESNPTSPESPFLKKGVFLTEQWISITDLLQSLLVSFFRPLCIQSKYVKRYRLKIRLKNWGLIQLYSTIITKKSLSGPFLRSFKNLKRRYGAEGPNCNLIIIEVKM